jgi:TBC1 domain family protein 5
VEKSSPWSQLQKDEELRAEILQDVERCMPENPYFRQPETQRMLLDILFIFCKLNQDVGYRQGMHEIAAPVVWLVESEAIDVGVGSRTLGEDATIKTIFDAEYIEHDAFAIFGQVMQSAKTFVSTRVDGNIDVC